MLHEARSGERGVERLLRILSQVPHSVPVAGSGSPGWLSLAGASSTGGSAEGSSGDGCGVRGRRSCRRRDHRVCDLSVVDLHHGLEGVAAGIAEPEGGEEVAGAV